MQRPHASLTALLMLYAGTSSYCATAVADAATEQAILARLAALEQNQRKL